MEEALARAKWTPTALPKEYAEEMSAIEDSWDSSMEDDLNTAGALGQVFTAVRLARRAMEDKAMRKSQGARELWERILADLQGWGAILGVFQQDAVHFLADLRSIRARRKEIDPAAVERLLEERAQARRDKDFSRSDAIREELQRMSVEVKDTPAGQEWEVL
jgi:cysteinyl-tRNA synthetase